MDSGEISISLQQLPLDLKASILFAVDELQTLFSLIRTCQAFYEVYTKYKVSLFKSNFQRHFDADLLRKALAVCISSRLPSHDFDTVVDFINGPLLDTTTTVSLPAQGTDMWFDLIRQQSHFEYFERDICRFLSTRLPWLRFEKLSLQWEERYRLYRSLCHMEIFHNLFRDYEGEEMQFDPDTICAIYLDYLPSWELEELAWIMHIFRSRLSISPLSRYLHLFHGSERTISEGMKFLRKLFESRDAEERRNLMNCKYPYVSEVNSLSNCLWNGGTAWTAGQSRPSFSSRLLNRDCSGPSKGWVWAQSKLRSSRMSDGVYNLLGSEDRSWACSLWSDERLRMAGKPKYVDWAEEDLKETYEELRDLI